MKRIDVELNNNKNLTANDKEFIKTHGGVNSKDVTFRSQSDGCIGLRFGDCRNLAVLHIIGDKVQLGYNDVRGDFRLSETGELVGTLRVGNEAHYTPIPAVIKLH